MRQFFSYLGENVSRTFRDWGKAELLLALLTYVVLSAGSFFSLAIVNAASSRIVLALAIAGVVWFGGLFSILTPARMVHEDRETIAALRDDQTRKLEILFDTTRPPFEQETRFPIADSKSFIAERRFRVGIRNASGVTIDDIRVEIDMEEIAFRPVPLHLMHDNPSEGQPYQQTFDLNPGEVKHIDVLARYEGKIRKSNEIILMYAVTGIPNLIPPTRHELIIAAYGRDTPRCERVFVVDVGQGDRMTFMPLAT